MYTEKEIFKLTLEHFGPNAGEGVFGKLAWYTVHRRKLISKLNITKDQIQAEPASQAAPSSFSEFWKKTL